MLGFFIVVVNSLQLENREVIAAIFVGAIGACTVAAAAVRFGVAYTSFKDSEASWRNTKRLLLWTNVEMGLVFVAVTLPAFRVIFRKRTGNTSSHGYGYSAEFPNKSLHGELGIATELSLRPRTAKMKKSATSSVVIPSVSSDRDLERPLRDDKTRSESSENLCPPNLIAHAR